MIIIVVIGLFNSAFVWAPEEQSPMMIFGTQIHA